MQENILTKTLRITLGAILLIFGLNKIFNFIPMPTPPAESIVYWGGLMSSNYILPTVMVIEILVGLSLIFKKYSALALLLLLPVTYNIFMYHLLMDINGLSLPLAMLIGQLYLIYHFKDSYSGLLKS